MSDRSPRQRASGERPWSVPIPVTDIPDTGRRFDLAADAATRAAVAQAAGVAALPRLEAVFELTRQGRNGVRVAGRVSAIVGQTCVVTLEPMESAVEETVDLVFAPPREPAPKPRTAKETDAADADADDPPEALRDGMVDLGAIATEFLLLGIDPYPRKPGAVFEAPATGDPASHPFAALAALKKGSGGKDA